MKKRLYYLDVLRCLSMIIVVYYHLVGCINNWTQIPTKMPYEFSNGITYGGVAVSIFFMISGASLFYVNDNQNFSVKSYYKKRVKSILPLFWITWIVFFLYNFYFRSYMVDNTIPAWRMIYTLLGIDQYISAIFNIETFGLISEWFLGCIIAIYILFPIIRIFFIKFPMQLFGFLLSIYVLIILFSNNYIIPQEFSIGIRMFEFAIGMYFVKYLKMVKGKFITIALLVITFIFLFIPEYPRSFVRIMTTLVAALIYLSCFNMFDSFKSSKVKLILYSISKYSYAVFLNHHVLMAYIFLDYLYKRNSPIISYRDITALILFTIIMIGVCSFVFVKVEKSIVNIFSKSNF